MMGSRVIMCGQFLRGNLVKGSLVLRDVSSWRIWIQKWWRFIPVFTLFVAMKKRGDMEKSQFFLRILDSKRKMILKTLRPDYVESTKLL
jgi:hypothetical protein